MARCTARTQAGARCKRNASKGSEVCGLHLNKAGTLALAHGSDQARREQEEDRAWAMWMRGANYAQIARTLEFDGRFPYANSTSVRRALERAFARHEVHSTVQTHRTKQDHVLNDTLQRLYRELQELQQPLVGEAMILAKQDGVSPDEAVRIVANAMEMDARRHPRVLHTLKEIRQTVNSLAKIWGTDRHTQHHMVNVVQNAPIDLGRLTSDERRDLLLAISADAKRRAAIPAAAVEDDG